MKWLKVGGVIFFAVIITALGIDASDTLSGKGGTLLGQIISSENAGVCPTGMVQVTAAQTFTCVDLYEASVGEDCPVENPKNEIDSKQNIDTSTCGAASVKDVEPWRFVTREQASLACMRAGKRLPKSEEWYAFSAGTPDSALTCNINAGAHRKVGESAQCISAAGVFDAIGNVWEWTADDVINGVYEGRELPAEGYVTQVDASGVATLTNPAAPAELFYKDYLWSVKDGAFGILRGGFYGSEDDAGVYAVHARTAPTAAGTAIGFRCVQ